MKSEKKPRIVIKEERCKGCNLCVVFCPKEVFVLSKEANANGYLCAQVNKTYRTAPCNNACPTDEKIQAYIDLINQSATINNFHKAWELLTADNPFPAVCGRVCFHPCEKSCNRGDYDEPINIHNIERFIGDVGLNESFKLKLPKLNKKFKIAIIGSGPAGLSCAYHLRRRGYQSTIFESDNKLGGLLTRGIPGYRLPQNITQAEIDRIIKSGIKIHLNTHINRDDFDRSLSKFDAVFVAIGAHRERQLNINDEKNKSVISALRFLYEISRGRNVKLGKKVGIIGGGNAAMDAARSVLRLRKKPIIIYRRTENEMPALADDILEAKEEGIEFIPLTAPKRLIIRDNKIIALECVRMKSGPVDKSGRRMPIPIKGSDFRIQFDTLITAIGEEVNTEFLPDSLKDKNRIKVLADGIRTTMKSVFAGGDAVTGPRTVVEALGAGKRAAALIHFYIKKEKPEQFPVFTSIAFNDLNVDYFEHNSQIHPEKSAFSSRVKSFTEVYKGYTTKQFSTECARCFSCGGCRICLECEMHCPDMAIEVTEK